MRAVLTSATPNLLAWRSEMAARSSVREVTRAMSGFLDANGRAVP
jgi:hypothetical protein